MAVKNHLNPLQKRNLTYPRNYFIVLIFKFEIMIFQGLINKGLLYFYIKLGGIVNLTWVNRNN